MTTSDFCMGFLVGFGVAVLLGFMAQQILLAQKQWGQKGKPMAVRIETDETPADVFWTSMWAGVRFLFLIGAVGGLLWLVAAFLFE